VSVVIATYNRKELLEQLLASLASQTLAPGQFEVVVVDDGSVPPALPTPPPTPYTLTSLVQSNAGPAAARHAGILVARGEIIVIVDDDMQPNPQLLQEHVRMHDAGYTLVLGRMQLERPGGKSPLYERFHARMLAKFLESVRRSPESIRGVHVCTGNVSFRRDEYICVGGFDCSLGRSEDRELGIRLEEAGAKLGYCETACTTNHSDISFETWWGRNYLYGVYDKRISRKHPDVSIADPWHYLFEINPVSRPLVFLTLGVPAAGKVLSRVAMSTAERLDGIGFERAAIAGATLSYGLEYFRGVRDESGSLGDSVRDIVRHARRRRRGISAHARRSTSVVGPPDEAVTEMVGYVPGTGIYYVHHVAFPTSRGAVLMLGPMAMERSHSYLTWVRWARVVARHGFDVMRFDYGGLGESLGRFEDATLDGWVRDACACASWFAQLRPNVPLFLHGLRLGALLASRMFSRSLGDGLLLWDPPKDGRTMFADTLRRKLAADYAERTGGTRRTRERYIEELAAGGLVEVEGFYWTKGLWDSSDGFSLSVPNAEESRPWCAIHLDGRTKDRFVAPANCSSVRLPKPPFWLESRTLVPDLNELFQVSLAWLDNAASSCTSDRKNA
jgi:glycosyltransferase involved in cell wall biosynthesis